MGAEFSIRTDGRTDTHDEAISLFSKFGESAQKVI